MKTSLDTIVGEVDRRPSSAAYASAARQLRESRYERRRVGIALLSSFTLDLLVPYLEVETARLGFAADVYVAPFNTVQQELLSDVSGCAKHQPDVVFVAQLLTDLCPALMEGFLDLSADEIEVLTERVLSDTAAALTAFRSRHHAALVVHNFALPPHPPMGLYEVMSSASQTAVIRDLNRRLVDAVSAIPGAYVLDFDRAFATVGYRHGRDERLWHLARAPLTPALMREVAQQHAGIVQAVAGTPRKCIVLDLDNTLWSGVVGELGRDGVELGGASYPGTAFRQFQLAIRQLQRRGVLLAINSKNNPEDVRGVLESHPGMILRPGDFAAVRINWRDKPANMIEIAAELKLGTDSLVFVDDNPAERELMRQMLPEVLTLEMPDNPTRFAEALLDCRAFDRVSMTSEDLRRTEMYGEQRRRMALAGSARSVDDFLRSLEMQVAIQPIDSQSFARAVDLIHKTNQFNLTTRRHSAAAVRQMMADASHGIFGLRVVDRFGDTGIVGIAIVRFSGRDAVIDTFALSCRVIGRTIETAFLRFLADWSQARGAERLEGEFVRTAKNAPAADLYERHGFRRMSEAAGGSRWALSLPDVPFAWPPYIRIGHETSSMVGTDAQTS